MATCDLHCCAYDSDSAKLKSAVPPSVKVARTDVGSYTGNLPKLAETKRLQEGGLSLWLDHKHHNLPLSWWDGPRDIPHKHFPYRLWSTVEISNMTIGVVSTPGSGNPSMGNFWWGAGGLPKPINTFLIVSGRHRQPRIGCTGPQLAPPSILCFSFTSYQTYVTYTSVRPKSSVCGIEIASTTLVSTTAFAGGQNNLLSHADMSKCMVPFYALSHVICLWRFGPLRIQTQSCVTRALRT